MPPKKGNDPEQEREARIRALLSGDDDYDEDKVSEVVASAAAVSEATASAATASAATASAATAAAAQPVVPHKSVSTSLPHGYISYIIIL
jgi:hypothetical protein